MIDYWVSFATSLDPNDGRGIPRKNPSSFRTCLLTPFVDRSKLGSVHPREPGTCSLFITHYISPDFSPLSLFQAIIELNGAKLTMIPDTYRAEQINYINSIPLVFHHRRGL